MVLSRSAGLFMSPPSWATSGFMGSTFAISPSRRINRSWSWLMRMMMLSWSRVSRLMACRFTVLCSGSSCRCSCLKSLDLRLDLVDSLPEPLQLLL